ncbi:TonB-dependent siderophore receptor [Nevskia ramosa]|uniref:TonB-dependent siderophore receptor n=1 Tax=Nevskia ramosa TaxID=64002 RepID=UPI0003B5D5B4|nr:TonB-dependent siderophore receptor [Nevskia ramosa]
MQLRTRRPLRLLSMAIASSFGSSLALNPLAALAQDSGESVQFFELNLPEQPLGTALTALSRETGVQVAADRELLAGRRAAALRGRYSAAQALERLLAGSGLSARSQGAGWLVESTGAVALAPVTVAGVRAEGFKAETQQTATKMQLSLRETPQSVTVITRESLDARQVQTLGQALELSAGVAQFSGNGPFASQPSFGFNQTTIRGIAIDDLYDFREDGFVNGSYFSLPDLAIYDRIEVVKGPNSVLYGRGSVGGLINRVRKKPLADARADIEVTAGSFDTYRADLDVTGPLGTDKARGRLVAAYADTGSFVDGPEAQRTVVAPSVELDLTPTTKLLVHGLYQSEDIIANTGFALRRTATGFDAPNIPRSQYNGVITAKPYTWETLAASATLEQKLGDRWLATLRLNATRIDTPIRVDAYSYGFTEGDNPETEAVERRGDTTVLGNDFEIDREIWSGELQLSGAFDAFGREVKTTFGVDHNSNNYSRRGSYTAYASGNLYDNVFEQPAQERFPGAFFGGNPSATGFYAQGQVRPIERLSVLLGLRYDEVSLRAFNGDESVKQTDSVRDVTGRVGLTYDLSEQVSVYSLYAQSFEPVLFSTDINGNLLKPETGVVYEFGTKTEWFGGRLGVNAALYRIEREDIPISAVVPPGERPYSVSSGLQRSDGVEVEANGRPFPGWDISLALNRVESEFKDPDDQFFGRTPGGSARWQAALYTAYEVQTGLLKGFGAGLTGFAIDDRGVSTFVVGTIPGYERLDLHAFYKGFRDVQIDLTLRNVTNARYIEGADRNNALAQFGSPTAVLLNLRYRFDGKRR